VIIGIRAVTNSECCHLSPQSSQLLSKETSHAWPYAKPTTVNFESY
jgi:hypothetical protein